MPKVSIALPTYNGEKYIKESINSVLAQTFTDWELIIVNDCSTDSTPEIVEQYAKQDSRIKIIHNAKNQKLPRSLNIGFREACGEFLTWTSDDNYYYPTALEELLQYLYKNPTTYMVCADMETIDSEGDTIGTLRTYNKDSMLLNNCVGACFLYRREVLQTVGDYDINRFLVEDYDYWLRIIKKHGEIGYIGKILYAYRFHEQSLTATRQKRIREQLLNLRKSNVEWIVSEMTCKRDLTQLYYDFFMEEFDLSGDERYIFAKVPELSIIKRKFKAKKPIVLYGAGAFGEKAIACLGDRVSFFADSDLSKVGTTKCGKKIISIYELVQKKDKYNIVISVSNDKIFDVASYLSENGVEECMICQHIFKIYGQE